MNRLGASPLLLSLMATAASLPFFLVTLPVGAIADLANRRNLFIAVYLWLAAAAGLLAVCTALRLVHPYVILTLFSQLPREKCFFLGGNAQRAAWGAAPGDQTGCSLDLGTSQGHPTP